MNLHAKNPSQRKLKRPLKTILILLSFILCLPPKAKAQEKKSSVNLELGLQIYEWSSVYLGIMNSRHLRRPIGNSDLFQTTTFYYENSFLDKTFTEGQSIGLNCSFGTNYLKVGVDGRYAFIKDAMSLYLGPSIRAGYKHIWLDFSYQWNPAARVFSDENARLPLGLARLRIVGNIPLNRKK